jgi:hypothetical protein
MGSGVGVHTDEQVGDLTPEERRLLKQFIILHLQTASDIREIISDDKEREKSVLPTFLNTNPKIQQKLVDASEELLQRLKKK